MLQWTPDRRELDDLELLTHGLVGAGTGEQAGFTRPEAGAGCPGLTLGVGREAGEQARVDGVLELLDPEGVPLARVRVEQTYDRPDGRVGIVGPVERLAHLELGPFRRYFRRPDGGARLGVAVVAPLSTAAIEHIDHMAATTGGPPLLVACVGAGSPQGVSGPGLVRATLVAAGLLPGAEVVAVPVARRDPDGPDTEADRVLREHVVGTLSRGAVLHPGTEGELPSAVQEVVDQDRPPRSRRGVVVFLTGLSGSGKSTIARALVDRMLERGDRTVTSLDGDVVRHHLSKGLGFGREDRETNIRRIGWVAAEISRHHGVAVCSPIAPFTATRQEVRAMAAHAGGAFVLVHVATPLAECERRDRKGLYARARAGEIPDFTGISSPYEEPTDADVRIDTTGRDLDSCVDEVLTVLRKEGWLA